MQIPRILKHRCENATVTATSLPVAIAARMAVIVVPMFAPRVNGKIRRRESSPAPARGTMIDVVTELLCTMAVIRTPRIIPTRSLRKMYLFMNSSTFASTRDRIVFIMKANAANLGEPKAVEDSLFFGMTKMNNNYDLVDSLQANYGCTATFFVKKGNDFIRISTNVMHEGQRAIGTQLDPDGPVIEAIQNDESFYGTVDILGSQYETGYEPIKNTDGEIIGVYYVGYQIGQ